MGEMQVQLGEQAFIVVTYKYIDEVIYKENV